MGQSAQLSRRKFMQVTAVATAAGPLVSCIGNSSPWRSLTEDEGHTLEAIVDRIIPADQDPGAAWAGVVNFIDKQLVGPYRRFRKTYYQGIAGTNEASVATFGKRFVELSAEQQDKLLQTIEKGQAQGPSWNETTPSKFFSLVLNHTMQGFYGDPRHGGNRDRVSWKMLHLPYPPVRGRLPDRFGKNS
jgi:gluconate 2-dehydrogenase gamma chain